MADLTIAARYLGLLDVAAPFTFQAIPEAKDSTARPTVLHGPFDEYAADLESLNRNGAGIFVMVFDLNEARVDRFLTHDPPSRRWLLEDCLPLGKVGLLVAPGGTGKSQLALQIAVAVATGGEVADWWQVGEKGRVLALFAEEDEEELHRRVWTILQGWA